MELAPAPVSLSEGDLVSQSPPSLPPGADDEQEPVGPVFVDVELEDEHAPASRPAVQAIAPRRSPNGNLRRSRYVWSSVVGVGGGVGW